eukprot:scaffold26459_cov162-Cylindrotheca_fusiformis.AAC.3
MSSDKQIQIQEALLTISLPYFRFCYFKNAVKHAENKWRTTDETEYYGGNSSGSLDMDQVLVIGWKTKPTVNMSSLVCSLGSYVARNTYYAALTI